MTDSTTTEIPLVERFTRFVDGMSDDQLIYRRADGIDLGASDIREAAAMLKAAVEALEWYREQAEGCRKVGYIGEPFRRALDADGGKRAADTLASLKQPGGI